MLETQWQDRVSNAEVPKRANMPSLEALLVPRQLRWTGHVVKMEGSRLPKGVFYTVSLNMGLDW